MSKTTICNSEASSHELTEDDLALVSGGKPSAAKSSPAPKISEITLAVLRGSQIRIHRTALSCWPHQRRMVHAGLDGEDHAQDHYAQFESTLAAKAATTTIPIVFVTGADPVKFGFVTSFNRPNGNLTGVWMVTTVLAEKRLQLMHDLLPKAGSIAMLINPTSPVAEPQTRDAQAAARALALNLIVMSAVSENDFDQVFMTLVQQRVDALLVSADPFFSSRREHFVALAARHAIPTMYEFREFVEVGGLMS